MKISLLSFLLLLSGASNAQNESYCIIYNEIYPLLDSGYYNAAKTRWLEIEDQYKIDPHREYLFIIESLKNDDSSFFKERITELIKNNGFHFFATDTLPENLYGHSELFYNKGIHKWLIKTSNFYYPDWIKNNPDSYLIQQKMIELAHDDQLFRKSIHFADVSDTNCTGRELSWDILSRCDYQNAATLATLSIRNGGLPNHFDNGYKTYALMGLIIWHNLKSEKNIHNTWMILSPHIDKAYFEGKIGSDLYAAYDHWLLHFTGYQYYGFEGNAPVENQSEFEKRKEKYKFCY